SPVGAKYDARMNRESAYEILGRRSVAADAPAKSGPGQEQRQQSSEEQGSGLGRQVSDILWGTKRRQGMVEAMAKQAARTVGSQVGRQILRGVLGGILGGSRRR
ncbi:MAG TPA: helicase HerA-like domain-containing protein, partial [Methylomirabilota bacterium]|nr:helicase HerA-like domain-containing protein [Methylomirabilota bacterium]